MTCASTIAGSGCSKYVGRVGALAVALGVGVLVTTGQGLGLGVARADTDTDPSGVSSADGVPGTKSDNGASAPESPSPGPAAGVGSRPSTAELTSDDSPSLTSFTDHAAPGMRVDSSGGQHTSTNDVGQHTDDRADAGAAGTRAAGDADAEADEAPAPSVLDGDIAQGLTAPEPSFYDSQQPSAQALTATTEFAFNEGVSPLPSGTLSSLLNLQSQPVDQADTADLAQRINTPIFEELAATTALSRAFASFPQQQNALTDFQTFQALPAEPIGMLETTIPRAMASIVTTVAGLLLSPFLAPGPTAPVHAPVLWALVAWVGREIQRTFFNEAPVITDQGVTLVLDPGETSTPIKFSASDFEDDPLMYKVPDRGEEGGPQHGIVTIDQATGTYTYTPDTGYIGPDRFTVKVSDAEEFGFHMHGLRSLFGWHRAHRDVSFVQVNVVDPNHAPVAKNDKYKVLEDGALTGNVLSNDADPDGDVLSAKLVSGAAHGRVALNSDGSFTYTPDEGFSGVDSFRYVAKATGPDSNTAIVTIAVTPVNDAPVAKNDAYAVDEDGTLTVPAGGVLNNDSDPEGAALTAALVNGPGHGALTFNPNGSFVYKPDEDYEGTDTFTYTTSDGVTTSNPAMVTVTVSGINDGPVAKNDTFTTAEETAVSGNVITNTNPDGADSDVDNTIGQLTAVLDAGPTHAASFALNGDGTFNYTPVADYNGPDSFTYHLNDGAADSNTATVSLNVGAANDPPVAKDDEFSTDEDTPVSGNVITNATPSGPDTDVDNNTGQLSAVLESGPASATNFTLNPDGTFNYTPAADFNGTDSFTYHLNDGQANSNTATVTLNVGAVPDAPIAGDDTVTVDEDSSDNLINVLAGDTDPDGDTLTVTAVSGATGGTVALDGDGLVTFTPDPNLSGPAAAGFDYDISDGNGGTDTGQVTINITGTNDAPDAVDDTNAVTEDIAPATVSGDVRANDTLGDGGLAGNTVALNGSSTGTHGALTLNTNGTYTYTLNNADPAVQALGTGDTLTDTYTYTLTDADGDTATADLVITITGTNDTPDAVDDTVTVNEDSTNNVIEVLANDFDVDGDTLTVTAVTNGANGTVTTNGTTVSYTPAPGYVGPDSFTYSISDGNSGVATATVNVTVANVNDTPVAVDDTNAVTEDIAPATVSGDVRANDTLGDGGAPGNTVALNGSSTGTHGALTLNTNGTYTYTLNNADPAVQALGAGDTLTDTYSYTLTDADGDTATADLVITITGTNDNPVAAGDTNTVTEDIAPATVSGDVLANDTLGDGGAPGNTVALNGSSTGTHGALTLNTNGTYTYTLNNADPAVQALGAGDTLTDTYSYTLTDADGDTATADLVITITGTNDTPSAVDDTNTVNEDTAPATVSGDVRANDTLGDGGTPGNTVALNGSSTGTHGALTLNTNGSYTYTLNNADPAVQALGTGDTLTDTYTYTLTDADGDTATADLVITITGTNDTPDAVDDTITVNEDSTNNVIEVLANDTDADGDTLTVTAVSGATGGTAVLDGDGLVTFTPDPNLSDTATAGFNYDISDGNGGTATGHVTINITAANDTPVAVDDTNTVTEDIAPATVSGDVRANDTLGDGGLAGNTVALNGSSTGTHGALTLNTNGSYTYTLNNADPAVQALGTGDTLTDTYTYTLTDADGDTATADLVITITGTNDTPDAADDSATIGEDTGANPIDVLANDFDVDGDTLTVTAVTNGANGTVTTNGTTVSYTPAPGYVGPDSFTYSISDGNSGVATATVNVTVANVNDAPVAVDDTKSTDEDVALSFLATDLTLNDTDIDGTAPTVTAVSGATGGTVSLDNGTITFTPSSDFTGPAGFDYTISDGTLTDTGHVTIAINPTNDAPVAVDDTITVPEDSTNNVINVLANDTDIDGGALAVTAVSNIVGGTIDLTGGTVNFIPTPNLSGAGAAGFDYTISDGIGGFDTGHVTIDIANVNDPPVAVDDVVTTDEDTPAVISAATLTGNDTDIDGDPRTITAVSNPTGGTVALDDGVITFTPTANLNGTGAGSFDYEISDDDGGTSIGTVSVNINPINDAPIAVDDTKSTNEDVALSFPATDLTGNDTDIDGTIPTVTAVSGATGGTVSLDNGTITFTPTPDFTGTAGFDYTISDGALTDTGHVTITINLINDPPVAVDDILTVPEDSTNNTINVLANDTDIDGGALAVSAVSNIVGGTVDLTGGLVNFTPTPNLSGAGAAGFDYTISDGNGGFDTGHVIIDITNVNDAPAAVDDTKSTNEDVALSFPATDLTLNDADVDGTTPTVTAVSGATGGTVALVGGQITFTPDLDITGPAGFDYTISDGTLTDTGHVAITINPINDNPIANADSYDTNEDTPLTITGPGVLANDTDAETNSLTAQIVTQPSHGAVTLNADGSFTYTPEPNYNGADSFTYRANDGADLSNIATVSINVIGVNDAPVAVADAYSVAEDGSLVVNAASGVLDNDTDVENSSLTAALVTGPTNGSLTLNSDGSFTYNPNANFNGTDTFTYHANDGAINGNIATATITVTSVNDAPVATNDAYSTTQGTPISISAPGVLGNDTDVENSSLSTDLVAGPSNGTLTLNPSGSFTYTPNTNFNGTDSFTYRTFDGTDYSNIATATITVVDNVAPTAVTVQTTNTSGSTPGRAEQGDTITYTFSEPIDPETILAGWDGSATNVTVRVYDGDILLGILGGPDSLQVFNAANTSQLQPLGTVNLGGDNYATGLLGGLLGSNIRFGATGTPSTMTMNGNTVTIVLGTYSANNGLLVGQGTETTAGTMVWTPSTGPEDLAGNALTNTAPVSESGAADRDF